MTIPLISCIMPTYNRRAFVPHAIRYYLEQEHPNKELIIIDDGSDPVRDLIPDHPDIRYYRLDKKITLGAKLNLACEYALGDILLHWDDDDWYAPGRLSYQLQAMTDPQIYICGINNLLYYDLRTQKAFNYIYPPDQRAWLLGSSLCYRKSFWQQHRFADIDVGMDGLFVWKTTPEHIINHPDPSFSVHMIHCNNVSPKVTQGSWWHPYPVEKIRDIMGPDLLYYTVHARDGMPGPFTQAVRPRVNGQSSFNDDHNNRRSHPVKNIYACLLHEQPDCVMDLIRNLRYHDPDSVIMLYNGGTNPDLLEGIPLEEFGVVICPYSSVMKWGYLHQFALHCMEFALEYIQFDTLTIVDSDQLAIRKGYCEYLGGYLSSRPQVGMLSSMPDKVVAGVHKVDPAIQAFQEYSLWKPFLQQFPGGENHFVHWTFWPSTVFTHHAARDLVKTFSHNRQLGEIMKQSRIWASEEIILPTLVKLLGYEIAANPCSYQYVKYKQSFTHQELQQAMQKEDAFWIHPIARVHHDPIRDMIRQRNGGYVPHGNGPSSQTIKSLSLINRIRKIEGWLSDKEAWLLIRTAQKACQEMSLNNALLEIGSYHGKSTVLFGSVVQQYSPGRKFYAVDPHDGKLGAADKGLQQYPPSFDKFKNNIERAGLKNIVEIIKEYPQHVQITDPISLLFIDGLHDYQHVASDFRQFETAIVNGGYVLFHDYADYFPGVQKMVKELLSGNNYRYFESIESLIVLQKTLKQ